MSFRSRQLNSKTPSTLRSHRFSKLNIIFGFDLPNRHTIRLNILANLPDYVSLRIIQSRIRWKLHKNTHPIQLSKIKSDTSLSITHQRHE